MFLQKNLPTCFNGAFHRLYGVDAADLTKSKTTLFGPIPIVWLDTVTLIRHHTLNKTQSENSTQRAAISQQLIKLAAHMTFFIIIKNDNAFL